MTSGGFTAGLVTEDQSNTASVEFLASQHYYTKRGGITVDAASVTADENGDKLVAGGTVLYLDTATGKYTPTANEGGAKGLLFAGDINLADGDTVCGLLIHGSVLEARCTGVDEAVKTALAGRVTFQ